MALKFANMTSGLYRGFSTHDYATKRSFKVNDMDIVKRDILNHIFTRRGERVMMPNFGTSIPDMPFEPLDDDTIQTIYDEVYQVIEFDPRVELIELSVTPDYDTNKLTVDAKVRYIELNVVDSIDFNITFEEG